MELLKVRIFLRGHLLDDFLNPVIYKSCYFTTQSSIAHLLWLHQTLSYQAHNSKSSFKLKCYPRF